MINFEQIRNIKKSLAHSKLAMWQALYCFMYIEDIDLLDTKEMNAEQIKEIRKKITIARSSIGQNLNELFELLHSYFLSSSIEKDESQKRNGV